MPRGWLETVAERAEVDVKEAEAVLSRRGIQPNRQLRPARRLQVLHVHFDGTKIGPVKGAFSFDWQLGNGVWALTSYDNLVGKSSVIEILFWVLRGEPKGLQDDVRQWLKHVQVEFAIDGCKYEVDFQVGDGVPVGGFFEVTAGNRTTVANFDSDVGFAAVMADFMMDAFALEPIPTFQESDEDGRVVSHGWAALSSVMYIGGDHKLLIGDVTFGLPGRLLQMYVGLPWARTLMQARTAHKLISHEVAKAKRTSEAIVARERAAAEDLRSQLKQKRARMSELEEETIVATRAAALAQEIPQLLGQLEGIDHELRSLRDEESRLAAMADSDERAVRGLKEDRAAAAFFNGLNPDHCPRCEGRISAERIALESSAKQCSVCAGTIPVQDEDDAALDEAIGRSKASKLAFETVKRLMSPLIADRDNVNRRLARARDAAALLSRNMNIPERRQIELEIAHLEGALSARTDTVANAPGGSSGMMVVNAAIDEARSRVYEAQQGLLASLNREIAVLAKRFGILALESVQLDLSARMKVRKGGEDTSFSRLTTGERLRLRVATAIELLRIGAEKSLGRHPGLLVIDSPAAEETTDQNLDTLLVELQKVSAEVPDLQVIIATAKAQDVSASLEPTHVRLAQAGEFLW